MRVRSRGRGKAATSEPSRSPPFLPASIAFPERMLRASRSTLCEGTKVRSIRSSHVCSTTEAPRSIANCSPPVEASKRVFLCMAIVPLFGHEELQAQLAEAVARNALPAALLFQGQRGVGKQRLALWLAQLLLCENGGAANAPCAPGQGSRSREAS